jgi:hypothetical protein
MTSRNSVLVIFRAMSLTVAGMLPVAALADDPMVIREVKHDLSRPLRDTAATAQSVQLAGSQQTPLPQRTGTAITNSQPAPSSLRIRTERWEQRSSWNGST